MLPVRGHGFSHDRHRVLVFPSLWTGVYFLLWLEAGLPDGLGCTSDATAAIASDATTNSSSVIVSSSAGGGEGEKFPSREGRMRLASVSSALCFSETTVCDPEAHRAAPEVTLLAATRGEGERSRGKATGARTFRRVILKVNPVAARVCGRRLIHRRFWLLSLGANGRLDHRILDGRCRAATPCTFLFVALGDVSWLRSARGFICRRRGDERSWPRPMFLAEGRDICFIYFLHISLTVRRYFRRFLRSHQPWGWEESFFKSCGGVAKGRKSRESCGAGGGPIF